MKFLLVAALIACAYAEPEADAYYSSAYGLGSYGYGGYGYGGLSAYRGYSAYPYTGYGYGYRPSYSYGSYRLHKRDAEAEPEADAYYTGAYGLGAYRYGGLSAYRGYSAYPYTYGYGYPSAYTTYGSYRLHKREADAEPEADAYYSRAYGYGYPSYGYRSYGYAAAPYRSYGYGRRYAYGYHH